MELHKSTYEQIFFKKQVIHIPHDSWFVESQIWRVNFESLFGGSSRGAQLLIYPWPKTGPPLSGMIVLFDRARSFGRDAHGAVRVEGDTRLASQISRINPGDQWGDRCHNQIALTSWRVNFKIYTEFQLCGMSFPNPHVQGSNDHHSVCTLDLWET